MLVNHVYHGDCLDVLKNVETGSVDLVVADPPYNLSGKPMEWKEKNFTKVNEEWDTIEPEKYKTFTNDWIDECHRALKDTGSIYICCSKHNLSVVMSKVEAKFHQVPNLITWYKTNSTPNKQRRCFTHASEFLVYAVKGPGYTFNYEELKKINPDRQESGELKQMRDVWFLPFCAGHERVKDENGKTAHPTQKPEALMSRCVVASSNPGELVVDPFVGVGTTPAVCKKLGRRWIGIDLEERFVRYSNERLAKIILPETSVLQTPASP